MIKSKTNRAMLCVFCALLLAVRCARAADDGPVTVPADGPPQDVRYVELSLRGFIPETLPQVYLLKPDIDTLYDLVDRIEMIADDDSVRGLIVRVGRLDAGWAKVQELREMLFRARRKGKTVVSFLEGGGNLEYYLASAADRVVMLPSASLMLVGLRAEVLFLKGLLDKIGVEGQFIQMGEYKGAAEPLTRLEASKEFREAINGLLNDYHHQLTEGIARGRQMKRAAIAELIDQGPFTAKRALESRLVDAVAFHDELLKDLNKREGADVVVVEDYGEEPGPMPQPLFPDIGRILGMLMGMRETRARAPLRRGPALAVIYATGPIIQMKRDEVRLNEEIVASEAFVDAIKEALRRKEIKAIVLRVDSPGGSAVASDIIWRELKEADKLKPVIVSMSDVAASGGYYIAAAGRTIISSPATITGSIGVVGGKLVVKDLLGKLGLHVEVFQRGRNAGMFSMTDRMSEEELARLRELLADTYETFLSRVAQSRSKPVEMIRKVAGGRPWTGRQAKSRMLVDSLGGLREALDAAKKAAGIRPGIQVDIVRLPRPRSMFEIILWGRGDGATMQAPGIQSALPRQIERAYSYLRVLRCFEDEPCALLMPAQIRIE